MGDVVGIIEPHWYDVANSLRALADEIEEGHFGEVTALAAVIENVSGELNTWCCGPASGREASKKLYAEAFLMYVT